MIKIRYKLDDERRLQLGIIECSDESEFKKVDDFLTYKEKVRKYNYRTRDWIYVEEKFKAFEKVDEKNLLFQVKLGIVDNLISYFNENEIEYEELPNEQQEKFITILEKWKHQYKFNPKEENAKIQLESAERIEQSQRGILSLSVGVGKTELLLSVAESYLSQYSGNVIIMTFTKKVLDEIILRAKKYNIESDRLMFMQPTGFMRSAKSKDEEFLEFARKTELIIADEAHHFTASSWQDLIDLINPIFLYGFTGSADVETGIELNFESFVKDKITTKSLQLMKYCGEMLIHKELTVPIKVFRIYGKFTDPDEYNRYKENNPTTLSELIQFTLKNQKFVETIAKSIKTLIPQDSICFIPELTRIETGKFISEELNKLDIPTVFYSAEYVNSPVGEIDITLEDLKTIARERMIKVLISNVVGIEGIDLPNLSSVIPITGKSFKNTIQPIGRSARSNLIYSIFIFDNNNPQYNRHARIRYNFVKSRMNVVSDEIIRIEV